MDGVQAEQPSLLLPGRHIFFDKGTPGPCAFRLRHVPRKTRNLNTSLVSCRWNVTLAFVSLAILGAFVLFGLFVFWTEPLWLLPGLERLTPNIVYRVHTQQPLVALSFDDGPHPAFTPQVLGILQRHDAKASFFLIGERAWRHPEVVAAIRARGHEIGNHYYRDVPTLGHSNAEFVRNFDQTEAALGLTAKPALFRPPGGIAWPRQIQLTKARGYICVLGCAYPHDPMHPPVWYIRWLIEKNLVPGAIVILHDGISNPSRTLRALPHILEAGHRKGLRFVSISELMSAAGGD